MHGFPNEVSKRVAHLLFPPSSPPEAHSKGQSRHKFKTVTMLSQPFPPYPSCPIPFLLSSLLPFLSLFLLFVLSVAFDASPSLPFPFLLNAFPFPSPPVPFSFLLKSFPSLPLPTCVKLPGKMFVRTLAMAFAHSKHNLSTSEASKKKSGARQISHWAKTLVVVLLLRTALEMLGRAEATEASTCTCCHHPQEQVRALQAGQKKPWAPTTPNPCPLGHDDSSSCLQQVSIHLWNRYWT